MDHLSVVMPRRWAFGAMFRVIASNQSEVVDYRHTCAILTPTGCRESILMPLALVDPLSARTLSVARNIPGLPMGALQ